MSKPQAILETLARANGEGTLAFNVNRYEVNVDDTDTAAAMLLLTIQDMGWTTGFTVDVLQAAIWWATYFASIPRATPYIEKRHRAKPRPFVRSHLRRKGRNVKRK